MKTIEDVSFVRLAQGVKLGGHAATPTMQLTAPSQVVQRMRLDGDANMLVVVPAKGEVVLVPLSNIVQLSARATGAAPAVRPEVKK